MLNVEKLYKDNINIMKYFRDENSVDFNNLDSILYSYDAQSGSYREFYYSDMKIECHINNEKTLLTRQESGKIFSRYLVDELVKLNFNSLLEVGTGEATSLCGIVKDIRAREADSFSINNMSGGG